MTSDASRIRKETPVFRGFMNYFPDAIMAVARHSFMANEKHNPGEPLHWSKGKSNDHLDCLARHMLDTGTFDEEFGDLHDVAIAWRALAHLQTVIEQRREAGEALTLQELAAQCGEPADERVTIEVFDEALDVSCAKNAAAMRALDLHEEHQVSEMTEEESERISEEHLRQTNPLRDPAAGRMSIDEVTPDEWTEACRRWSAREDREENLEHLLVTNQISPAEYQRRRELGSFSSRTQANNAYARGEINSAEHMKALRRIED